MTRKSLPRPDNFPLSIYRVDKEDDDDPTASEKLSELLEEFESEFKIGDR